MASARPNRLRGAGRAAVAALLSVLLAVPFAIAVATPASATDVATCGESGSRDTSLLTSPGLVGCVYGNRGVNGVGGQADSFTVPTNTHKLQITLDGGVTSGLAKADLAVVPGQVLQINVGGFGESGSSSPGHRPAGGWNGGGPGGTDGFGCLNDRCGGGGDGAVDVRTGGYGLGDRVLVDGAAGGGMNGSSDRPAGGGEVAENGVVETCTSCAFDYQGAGTAGNQSGGGPAGGNATAGGFGGGGQGGNGAPTLGATAIGGTGGGAGWYGGGGGSGRVYGGFGLIYLQGSGGGGSGHAGPGTSNVTLTRRGGSGASKHATIQSVPDPYATTTTVVSSSNPSTAGQPLTFTATVSTAGPDFPIGGGQVRLVNGFTGQAMFTAQPLVLGAAGTGTATFSAPVGFPNGGTFQVVAGYDGFSDPGTPYTDASSSSDNTLIQTAFPKLAQTVSFTTTAPSGAVVGDSYAVAAAGGGSGNPVLINGPGNTICTQLDPVDGVYHPGKIFMIGAGQCVITARQAGNDSYLAASATQSFSVALPSQTVTFTSTAPTNAQVGGSYTVSAVRSGSGPAITFAANDTRSVCTVSGSTVTFVGAGICRIFAFAAAAPGEQGSGATQPSSSRTPRRPPTPTRRS